MTLSVGKKEGDAVTPTLGQPVVIQTVSLMGRLPAPGLKRYSLPPGQPGSDAVRPAKPRRVVKRDPNKPPPKAWTPEELARFQEIVRREGPGSWEQKAKSL